MFSIEPVMNSVNRHIHPEKNTFHSAYCGGGHVLYSAVLCYVSEGLCVETEIPAPRMLQLTSSPLSFTTRSARQNP